MGYDQFWFIETRDQKKNLKRWFLWGILLFAFVSVGTTLGMQTIYRTISNYEVQATIPEVTVEEAKTTNVNGYIRGVVKNNGVEEINAKYIKFAFYTKNEVNIGNEYIEIGTLKPDEAKTYEQKYRYNNVERFVITITDTKE